MSTFFRFYCTSENSMGGFFAQYAWGTGMFDIIESFKYLTYCIKKHGTKSIRVISEHDDEYDESINISSLIAIDDNAAMWRAQFLTFTRNVFPYSDEWVIQGTFKHVNADDDTRAEDWFNHERYWLLHKALLNCSTELVTGVWKEFIVSDLANNYSLLMSQQLLLFLNNEIEQYLNSNLSDEYKKRKKEELESIKLKIIILKELERSLV